MPRKKKTETIKLGDWFGQNRRVILKECVKRGMDVTGKEGKDVLAQKLYDSDLSAEHEKALITPEELIRMEEDEHAPTRPPEPRKPRKFKQVFVTYFGSDADLQHSPPGRQYVLSFHRGRPLNLWHELWRLDRRLKENPDILEQVYHDYVEYYTRKASVPSNDWLVQSKLLGLPIETVGKDARSVSLQLRDVLAGSWESVITQVKAWKHDPDAPRPYPEIVTMMYNLEQDGYHRKTLMQFLDDELKELNNRDPRLRETSE